MPPKANKRKTNGNGKGEEKKQKYLHNSDSDTPSKSKHDQLITLENLLNWKGSVVPSRLTT